MNRGLWIARKNHLCCLIRRLSDGHGGDDIKTLSAHYMEVLEAYHDEQIEIAIKCYEEMVEKLKYYPERKINGMVQR